MMCNRLIHSMLYEGVTLHLCHLLLFYSMASPLWYSIYHKLLSAKLLCSISIKIAPHGV
jgi:hypothetical protein